MDKIAALNESDVPTDEDKLEVLKRDDLKEFNDRIDHVTSLLDALAAST